MIFLLSLLYLSSESHNVYSSIRLNQVYGQIPDRTNISFKGYLLKDKNSVLNHLSNGSFYDAYTGVFGFNIGNFNSSWEVNDSLFISVKYKEDSISLIWVINGTDQIEPFIFADHTKKNYRVIFNEQATNFSSLRLSQNEIEIFDETTAEIVQKENKIELYFNRFLNSIDMNKTVKLEVLVDSKNHEFIFSLDTLTEFIIEKNQFSEKRYDVILSKTYFSKIPSKENNSINFSYNFSESAKIIFYNIKGKKLLELEKANNQYQQNIHISQFNLDRSAIILFVVAIDNEAIYKNTIGFIK